MSKVFTIGSLVKKIYRIYSIELLELLKSRGHSDLRPSFLDILMFVCNHDGPSIKEIGDFCGLKKQTMTGHLNDLEMRGYIYKESGISDKREQKIYLTDHGQKFKFNINQAVSDLEGQYRDKFGDVELERMEIMLSNFYQNLKLNQKNFSNRLESKQLSSFDEKQLLS